MFVSVGIKGGLSVQLELEAGYQPDILDDLCNRARDLFRLSLTDSEHITAEHDKPAE
jgi:hypothetical protein